MANPGHKQSLGARGEQIAVDYLTSIGYDVVDRNWRGNRCELDVVALDRAHVVFVEVKTRGSSRFGSPLEAITPTKLSNMTRAAFAWLHENYVHHDGIRFDAIGIEMLEPTPRIVHIRGVSR